VSPTRCARRRGKDKKGEGRIVNSAGDTDGAAWGKKAAWCDYYGPVGGETVGVAIFDHPENLRHPTTWHVRDYGLFAVNPFGLHDFDPALKNNPNAGDHLTPEGQTLRFRYRLLLHRGTTRLPACLPSALPMALRPRSNLPPTPPRRPPRSLTAKRSLAGSARRFTAATAACGAFRTAC
jgi:hypothetical protein